MIKFIKENWKILLPFLIVAILFPIIILVPSPIGIIPKDVGLQIVGYVGSILGGFLTLYGVWWTIKEQKKDLLEQQQRLDNQRREDLAIQYKPLIKISEWDAHISTNLNKHTLSFSIKNIGRGEANRLKIKFDDDIEIIDYNTDCKNHYYINTFPSGEIHPIKIKYHKNLNSNEATEEDRIIEFYIHYEDLYSVYDFTTIGQILIHPKTWPHTIKSINGEIESKKR